MTTTSVLIGAAGMALVGIWLKAVAFARSLRLGIVEGLLRPRMTPPAEEAEGARRSRPAV
ncbi:MAG TPA: hypothetical protein VGD47_09750, partial [Steroidobacteraceae bacterium]